MTATPLCRSTQHRVVAGVCAGLAAHLKVPIPWVRAVFIGFTLLGGAGALLYLWLWIFTAADTEGAVAPMRRSLTKPAAPGEAGPRSTFGDTIAASVPSAPSATVPRLSDTTGPRRVDPVASPSAAPPVPAVDHVGEQQPVTPAAAVRWPIAELILGTCLLVAGIAMVLVQVGVQLPLEVLLPGLVVLAGVGLTWWQIADRARPDRNMLPRVLGALALVAVGVLMFFINVRQPSVLTVIGAAVAVLAGVALALAPWALRLNRELIAERAAREREAERAEIAAHLHDSVLQTLAAIQQRSAPGSDVARLARGQERDLREWLFRGADGASEYDQAAMGEVLRQHAAALEDDHSVRFEVVTVGSAARVPEPVLAAAREAMLNAAQHAGGEVTVYAEAGPEQVSIDVTDRGPGFTIDSLPDGRMGVRESILGRMQRAGGSATFVPGPAGVGTSVRLRMPLRVFEEDQEPGQRVTQGGTVDEKEER